MVNEPQPTVLPQLSFILFGTHELTGHLIILIGSSTSVPQVVWTSMRATSKSAVLLGTSDTRFLSVLLTDVPDGRHPCITGVPMLDSSARDGLVRFVGQLWRLASDFRSPHLSQASAILQGYESLVGVELLYLTPTASVTTGSSVPVQTAASGATPTSAASVTTAPTNTSSNGASTGGGGGYAATSNPFGSVGASTNASASTQTACSSSSTSQASSVLPEPGYLSSAMAPVAVLTVVLLVPC